MVHSLSPITWSLLLLVHTHFANAATASAFEAAKSCASALSAWEWSSHFFRINLANSTLTTSVPTRTHTLVEYDATRVTSLCDGHPRIIGHAVPRASNKTTVQDPFMTTITTLTSVQAAYPTPRPVCYINAALCKSLYSLDSALAVPLYGTPVCNVSQTLAGASSTSLRHPVDIPESSKKTSFAHSPASRTSSVAHAGTSTSLRHPVNVPESSRKTSSAHSPASRTSSVIPEQPSMYPTWVPSSTVQSWSMPSEEPSMYQSPTAPVLTSETPPMYMDPPSMYETATTGPGVYTKREIHLSPSSYGQGALTTACSDCTLVAESAQLLYWPVRVKNDTRDLCESSIRTIPVEVVPGEPTGSGPNTFVTEGVTITSPSVAISLTGLSCQNGCFSTIASTIIPVDPSKVSSLRQLPPPSPTTGLAYVAFDFADLNYECLRPDGSLYISGAMGPDCYPAVPAGAYFYGSSAWNWVSDVPKTVMASLTIANDYRPDILMPDHLSAWVESEWGVPCILSSCGVWDPPKCLPNMLSEALPSMPSPVTVTSDAPVSTTSAAVAESAQTQPVQTSTAEPGSETPSEWTSNALPSSQTTTVDTGTQSSSKSVSWSASSETTTAGLSWSEGPDGSRVTFAYDSSTSPSTGEDVDPSTSTTPLSTDSSESAEPNDSALRSMSASHDASAVDSSYRASVLSTTVAGGADAAGAHSNPPTEPDPSDPPQTSSHSSTSSCNIACHIAAAFSGTVQAVTSVVSSSAIEANTASLSATENPTAVTVFHISSATYTQFSTGSDAVIIGDSDSTVTIGLDSTAAPSSRGPTNVSQDPNSTYEQDPSHSTSGHDAIAEDDSRAVFTIGDHVYTAIATGAASIVMMNDRMTATLAVEKDELQSKTLLTAASTPTDKSGAHAASAPSKHGYAMVVCMLVLLIIL